MRRGQDHRHHSVSGLNCYLSPRHSPSVHLASSVFSPSLYTRRSRLIGPDLHAQVHIGIPSPERQLASTEGGPHGYHDVCVDPINIRHTAKPHPCLAMSPMACVAFGSRFTRVLCFCKSDAQHISSTCKSVIPRMNQKRSISSKGCYWCRSHLLLLLCNGCRHASRRD